MRIQFSLFLHEDEDRFGWIIEYLVFDEIQYPDREVGWEISLEIQAALSSLRAQSFRLRCTGLLP